MKTYAQFSLRDADGTHNDCTTFVIPVTRIWFEGVKNDLHIQFEGFEDTNICPAENAYADELMLPLEATELREWLEVEERVAKKATFSCIRIEQLPAYEAKPLLPPPDVIKSLIKSWGSPNSSRPYPKF